MNFENVKRMWSEEFESFHIELENWKTGVNFSENRWNIYVRVFKDHKWYRANIDTLKTGVNLCQEEIPPLHKGITWLSWTDEYIEVGCHYHHDDDDFYKIEEDPYTFELDINALVGWFKGYGDGLSRPIVRAPSDNGGTHISVMHDLLDNYLLGEPM